MSIKIMAAVYDSDLTDIYDVTVLLALANHADDDGRCYPSMARICRLSRCSERKAQSVVKSLAERGYITIEPNAGPRGCNVFTLTPHPKTTFGLPWSIFRRDGFRCVYCGFQGTEDGIGITIDHILPRSRGGTDDPDNLCTACSPCNTSKKDRTPEEWKQNPARDPRTACTPHAVHPAPHAPRTSRHEPPHAVHHPPAQRAPEPSENHQEPSGQQRAPAKARLPEGWVPSEAGWQYARSLQLHDSEISEIADEFHAYWADRTDKDSRKSERGWEQCWRNRLRDVAPKWKRNRAMAGPSDSRGYGQGGSIASLVARRRALG